MAMKKKFLGLALATMVALPATSAYAAPNVIMGENDTQTHSVTVSGAVKSSTGQLPEGRIEVELPTAMAFTVHEDSSLTAPKYSVKNTGSVDIKVEASNFQKTSGNINVKKKSEFEAGKTGLDRSNIYLELKGNVDGQDKSVDLGDLSNLNSKGARDILTVAAGTDGVISLAGAAGKNKSSGAEDVERNGAAGEFSLIFKITKK